MISYRKIGGLHWLFIGRFRFAWCIKRREPRTLQPITKWPEINITPGYTTLPKISDHEYEAYWSHRPQRNNIMNW